MRFKVSLTMMAICFSVAANAAVIRPSERHEAGGNKTGRYFAEGFFAGGEKSVTSAKLKDIRRAKSREGFERVVLDLEPQAEDRDSVPYFQAQMSPQEGRIVLSIWADVLYDFDAARIRKAFAKSASVKRLNVIPRVEDGLTIIEFILNPAKAKKLEVFRLTRPSRIIMDIL